MRILYTTDQTYLHGGVEKVLSQKANYLADVLGDEVIILRYAQNSRESIYNFSKKIKFVDFNVEYNQAKSFFHPTNLKKIPKHWSSLKKMVKNINPDIIISNSMGADFYFLPYIENKTPKIKENHSSLYFYRNNKTSLKNKCIHQLNSLVEKNYDHIVVLNDSERNYYTLKNISVIPNPAEISGERINFASKKILAAGRISPVKNFGDLIESFSRLSPDYPEWELHLYGEDYLGTQQTLQQKINDLRLQEKVIFMGVSADLKNEMKNYSIYGMTSETECFPMVLLEALSVGLPVITYDAPTGPKHLVKNNEDAFLIPHKDIDAFTAKLKILMDEENLRKEMGKKGIQNVRRFGIEEVMKDWKHLFNKLVD